MEDLDRARERNQEEPHHISNSDRPVCQSCEVEVNSRFNTLDDISVCHKYANIKEERDKRKEGGFMNMARLAFKILGTERRIKNDIRDG